MKEAKWKVGNVAFLVFIVILFWYTSHQLTDICTSVQNCTSTEREGVWVPLKTISIYLALLIVPFLFIPQHYFKAWLYRIASWSLPVAALFILDENPSSGSILSFGRDGMAKIMGIIIINITLVFLLYHYVRANGRLQKVSWYWFIVLLLIMLATSTQILKFLF